MTDIAEHLNSVLSKVFFGPTAEVGTRDRVQAAFYFNFEVKGGFAAPASAKREAKRF